MVHNKVVVENKKAAFNYFIEEVLESGVVLRGTEVKSIRIGGVNIDNSYIQNLENELFLYNCHIAEYSKAYYFNHSTTRVRKLLLKKHEIKKVISKIILKGFTAIPLSIYFNNNNLVKVRIGIATGKKLYDKRNILKHRSWVKEQSILVRTK